MHNQDLWAKLEALCAKAPDGVYVAGWSQFSRDTGGYTINSLAPFHVDNKIGLKLHGDMDTYDIWIIGGAATATSAIVEVETPDDDEQTKGEVDQPEEKRKRGRPKIKRA